MTLSQPCQTFISLPSPDLNSNLPKYSHQGQAIHASGLNLIATIPAGSIPTMANSPYYPNVDAPDPWDYASFYKEASAAFDYEGMYQSVPLHDEVPKSQFSHGTAQYPSTSISGQNQMSKFLPHTESYTSDPPTSSSKLPIPPAKQQVRKPRNPPSADALARRRQQNRASQLAFRERSKREVDTLRQELAECSEDNQKMYFIMRGLLERTESLKVAIEDALVTHKPRTYRNMSARSGVEFGTSPRSSSDGQPLDDGAAE